MAVEKNKGGRPAFAPTDAQRNMVDAMSGYGIPEHQIRLLVKNPETGNPIAEKTLRQHFRDELDTGFVKANAKVVETLWKQATAGNVAACIWWTKGRMGWSEKVVSENVGEGGGPIKHEYDLSGVDIDALRTLAAVLESIEAPQDAAESARRTNGAGPA